MWGVLGWELGSLRRGMYSESISGDLREEATLRSGGLDSDEEQLSRGKKK